MSTIDLWKRRCKFVLGLRLLWGGLALGAVTVLVLVLTHSKQEACLRWWGMALQFAGIVMVVKDVRGAQRQFNQPGLRDRLKATLAAWPRPGPVVIKARAETITFTGSPARITLRAPMDPAAAAEARLSALEQNFRRLDSELGQVEAAAVEEQRARTEADEDEAAARAAGDANVRQALVELSTGSFSFSLFGVVWLTVGLVISSTSVEVAKWAARVAKATQWTW